MLRLIVLALAAATLLSAGPTQAKQLTKREYIAAANRATGAPVLDRLSARALDFELPGQSPTRTHWLQAERRLRTELDHVADRLEVLDPPAEVASIHAAWVSSLRSCAQRLQQLETTSPLDPLIAERQMEPCFAAHSRVCDRFYARGYSFG
jgi:hypothetical protein